MKNLENEIIELHEEIESCIVEIEKLNEEIDFIKTYTNDHQRFSDRWHERDALLKQVDKAAKRGMNLEVVNHKTLILN